MPQVIKKNITNLAYFIFSKTFDLMFTPDRSKLDVLININKNIARGLYSTPDKTVPANIEAVTEQKETANQNNNVKLNIIS